MSAAQQQNFANWYTYYRTRIQMIKSAASLAFDGLDNTYRVGFIIINPGNPVTSTKFSPLDKFEGTHRSDWFKVLFIQSPGSATPLREALARVGRYYAGKTDGINSGMIDAATGKPDPVQYSCQQNFSILTTDGYWNTSNETVGPVGLDGLTKVGEQDGDAAITPRPLYDGASGQTRLQADAIVNYQYGSCSSKTTTQYFKTVSVTTKTTTAQTGTTEATNKSTIADDDEYRRRPCEARLQPPMPPPTSSSPRPPSIFGIGDNDQRRRPAAHHGQCGQLQQPFHETLHLGGQHQVLPDRRRLFSDGERRVHGSRHSGERCVAGAYYVTVLSPAGSGDVTYGVTFSSSGSPVLIAASFRGGSKAHRRVPRQFRRVLQARPGLETCRR